MPVSGEPDALDPEDSKIVMLARSARARVGAAEEDVAHRATALLNATDPRSDPAGSAWLEENDPGRVASESRVASPIHLPHTARTEQRAHLVPSELCLGIKSH